MIFSVQRHLEDHLERRRLIDTDQYAVRLANLYDRRRMLVSAPTFLLAMRRLRTVFFRTNRPLDRTAFEQTLLRALDKRFKEKKTQPPKFPGGVFPERRSLGTRPRRMGVLLGRFRSAVEARAVDVFWKSRKAQHLRSRPEQIGQALLALFLREVLSGPRGGLSFEQVKSGIGFVDMIIVFSRTPHLVELKVFAAQFTGAAQLTSYMTTQERREGWLVVFDARPPGRRGATLPHRMDVPAGTVRIIAIDINPTPPSRQRDVASFDAIA